MLAVSDIVWIAPAVAVGLLAIVALLGFGEALRELVARARKGGD